MSRWHQIGLSFLFSFFTDHATFCSNKLVGSAMCSMVPLPIPSKAIASARARSSERARITRRPLWTGPTWVYVLAYCIMYHNVFFFNTQCYSVSPSPSLERVSARACQRAPCLCHVVTLRTLHHVVSVCSHRFFQPNRSPESKTEYQKQSIGTVSGSPALNLSLDDFFWVSIL
jgi:hypothetical protein